MGRVLTASERLEVVKMAKGGIPRKRIALIYGVTPRTIWNIISPKPKVADDLGLEMEPPSEKPDDDLDNPPQWRCKCGRLVIGQVECTCGKVVRWVKQDRKAHEETQRIAREEGWIA